jgi:hypothetical protein
MGESHERKDVTIKPPPATVYAKASLPVVMVTRVSGIVEKLTAEGASEQTILEEIRSESPEIAQVMETNAARRPQGWTLHQWVTVLLAAYMAAFMTYDRLRPNDPGPSPTEIAEMIDDALSRLGTGSGEPHETPPPTPGASAKSE